MLSRLSRSKEHEMSTGIFQSHKIADPETQEPTRIQSDLASEQPTVADLVLPGTGYNFSDEFACLLNVLGGAEREQP
jgi:hypothetical protein